jgi:hypothetical protein
MKDIDLREMGNTVILMNLITLGDCFESPHSHRRRGNPQKPGGLPEVTAGLNLSKSSLLEFAWQTAREKCYLERARWSF